MTAVAAQGPADLLHDIESVTDAALSRLAEASLLQALLDRIKETLQATLPPCSCWTGVS